MSREKTIITENKAEKPIFIIAVVGPTATGKSDFAVQIAKIFDGEIISADSRQVYTGLDIGSGKITKKEMLGVPHYGLDIVNPKKVFNASDFKSYAKQKIAEISARGKTPIICGGTGFYIDSVIGDLTLTDVPPNPTLRKKLEKLTTPRLLVILKKLNKNKYDTIDQFNRVRIIRAIEIEEGLRKNKETLKTKMLHSHKEISPKKPETYKYKILWLGLDADDNILKEIIHTRLLRRLKSGMLDEAKRLRAQGISYKRMFELGLEYRYQSLFLQNKISKEEMIEKIDSESWQYVKRQRTWFKRNKNIVWIKRG